uniref:Asp-tRNA(Asn)/Glu-tRNA(Gln) amidotransferase subunit GatC n=1 Tax=Staphylococcus pasteuri TaxID=45972 RepID=UPI0012B85EC7
ILDFAKENDSADTEGVEARYHVLDLENVLGEDKGMEGIGEELGLKNGKESENGEFKVGGMMNEEEG